MLAAQKILSNSKQTMKKSVGHISSTAHKPKGTALVKNTIVDKFGILLECALLAESVQQEGPLLFSSEAGAEAELRFHPRLGARIVFVQLKIFI